MRTAAPGITEDGLPTPQRHYAMLTIAISITLAVMDAVVANVALPVIATDFNISAASAIWIVNGYQLAVVVCLIPFARLGEIYGYRTVYMYGLTLFILSSLACMLANSMPLLTLARVVQGIGAAGLMSVNTALIRYIVPRAKLGGAIGINALVVAMAATVGPTLAGGILSVASWPWLFAINLPLGLAAIVLAMRSLPDNDRSQQPFDSVSALLSALMIGLAITAIESIGHKSNAVLIGGQLGLALVATILLVRREASATAPLFPFDLLRIPVFSLSLATSIASFTTQMLAFVSLPFLFHHELALTPAEVGLMMTPWPLATGVMAMVAGRLSDRMSPAILGGVGLLLLAVGMLALSQLSPVTTLADIAWRMALCGAGFGLFQSPNNRLLVTSAPRQRSGAAGGMLGTARLIGQSSGTALVGMLLARFDMQGGYYALYMGCGTAALACLLSFTRQAFNPSVADKG
ncbi:MFS transporter [Candidatus Symbiopectobacterium sp. NZEC151]|uniref:MFS transporter n=3 Tax=ant, tsetse, mealybug, aphid, etc. endosymbionts TaxID=84563 RepID=UPI002227A134|nr:MFS transporter [Candidatus Symbiopectobacterium sp. NZEC151]MCW2473342.1 MFS transporter [Candidatus Symbiopectobacterium sp. NZEC151]